MTKRQMVSVFLLSLLFALALLITEASAQDRDREGAIAAGAKLDKDKVNEAVKKGCQFVKSRQNADGAFVSGGKCRASHLPAGLTALCLLALIKGGEDPNSDCITKGFDYIYRQNPQFERVYSVSCLILAIAARYEPPEELQDEEIEKEIDKKDPKRTTLFEPPEKKQERGFKKAPAPVKQWMTDAVKWLLAQQKDVWSYGPSIGGLNARVDASNSQYAMLALHAATRCGIDVPAEHFTREAEYFILTQESNGPEVEGFPVPVADFEVKKLKEMEKEILQQMKQRFAEAKEKGEKIDKEKLKGITTGLELEDPYRRFRVEQKKIKARGWSYLTPQNQKEIPPEHLFFKATGSMTCSGIAALCIAKANVEGTSWFSKYKEKLNSAIRDGCGWLAQNFSVDKNPNSPDWHYYFLYGLERAGVLSLCRDLGKHNWYDEGGNFLLTKQQGDGSWPGETGKEDRVRLPQGEMVLNAATLDPLVNTCFAILFLKRATAPIVKLPGEIYTGEGLLGPKKEPEPKK
jgi:hypothetical protein